MMASTGCSTGCKKEFGCTPRNVGCRHDDPILFGTSQWKVGPPILFIIFHRLPWAIFWLGYFLYDIIITINGGKYFTYMTNWQIIIIMVTSVMGLIASCIIQAGHMRKTWNPLLSIYWVLFNVASAFAPAVTVIYWALLYDSATYEIGFISIVTHAVNTVYTVIDVMVVAIPLRSYHFYHSAIIAGIYVIFAAIYTMTTGTVIYSLFDFQNQPTMAAAFGIGGICIGILMWFIMFGLYHLRVFLANRCCQKIGASEIEKLDRMKQATSDEGFHDNVAYEVETETTEH